MAIEKRLALFSTQPATDNSSVQCIFSKSTFVDGVEQEGAEQHALVIPRYVGPNADIPSNIPYLRRQLDASADHLGFERCTDADWQTIEAVCQVAWAGDGNAEPWDNHLLDAPPDELPLSDVVLSEQPKGEMVLDSVAALRADYDALGARLAALEAKA